MCASCVSILLLKNWVAPFLLGNISFRLVVVSLLMVPWVWPSTTTLDLWKLWYRRWMQKVLLYRAQDGWYESIFSITIMFQLMDISMRCFAMVHSPANFLFLELLNWFLQWLGLDKEFKRLVVETTGNQASVVVSVLEETMYSLLS